MVCDDFGVNSAELVLESLARFDTSTAKQLEISYRDPPSKDLLYQALLPMKNLRTLTIPQRKYLHPLIRALDPEVNSSNVLTCPKLEELHLCFGRKGVFYIETVVGMAVARASRGAKLRSVRVVNPEKFAPLDLSELRKHVSEVEYDVEGVEEADDYSDDGEEVDYSDDSDEED